MFQTVSFLSRPSAALFFHIFADYIFVFLIFAPVEQSRQMKRRPLVMKGFPAMTLT